MTNEKGSSNGPGCIGIFLWIGLAVLVVSAIGKGIGCGGDSKDNGSRHSSTARTTTAAKRAIKGRELAALAPDPNFLGEPIVGVSCSASTCKARLSADLAVNIPLAIDHWSVGSGKPRLQGGSNIVGFIAADAHLACMNHYADTGDLSALLPCSQIVAHKLLP